MLISVLCRLSAANIVHLGGFWQMWCLCGVVSVYWRVSVCMVVVC